jgi:hypothetical protein
MELYGLSDVALEMLQISKGTALREQLRRTADFLQPDDPSIYYYLAWASPP